MLGPNKWRLLTIVAGLLLAHAIDSPVRTSISSPQVLSTRSTSTANLGLSVQHVVPSWTASARSAATGTRNLYRPYQTFSNIDNVRYVEKRFGNEQRNARQSFGSFRYPENSFDVSRRRSDGSIVSNVTDAATTKRPQRTKRPIYAYIPLGQIQNAASGNTTYDMTSTTSNTTNIDEIQSRTDTNIFPDEVTTRSKITFPGAAAEQDITGRRSGIQFAAQSQKFGNLFQPQGYREDNPSNPNYQFPYSEELSAVFNTEQEPRYTRGISFEQPRQPTTAQQQQQLQQQQQSSTGNIFRDDVTKFGDVNGPVTALQHRQYSDYIDKPYYRPYENNGYYSSFDEYSRSPRYYTPPKAYVEYSEYPGPPKSRLITPWKSSRTPRVVFPQAGDTFPSGSGSTGTGSSSYASDNVVFR